VKKHFSKHIAELRRCLEISEKKSHQKKSQQELLSNIAEKSSMTELPTNGLPPLSANT